MQKGTMTNQFIENFKTIYFTEEEIQARILELAKTIEEDYQGKELHLVIVLRGSAFFGVDLAKRIQLPLHMHFIRASSYVGDQQKEQIQFDLPLNHPLEIQGKDVLVVEDIIDSGNTISALLPLMEKKEPKSIQICSLLHKHFIKQEQLAVHYIGFNCPDDWVVGYGLDYHELYRNLPFIAGLPVEMR